MTKAGSVRCQNPPMALRILVAFAAMKSPLDGTEYSKACDALKKWAKVHAQRDEVIRRGLAAGVGQRHIQEITGVARTTIARIARSG